MTALTCLMFGCSKDPEPIDIKKKVPISSTAPVSEVQTTREGSAGNTGRLSKSMGRQLDEAGSVKREHPAAGMERPDKWEREVKLSATDVSRAANHEAVSTDGFAQLESVGMKNVKGFLVDLSPEEFLEEYRETSPRARVVEQDGAKLLTIPVKEGTMMVTTANADGKTMVCEILIPENVGYEAADWVSSFQEAARRKME